MFKSKAPALPPSTDFTNNLKETSFYRYGHLRPLGLTGEVTALAVDPTLSLIALGTSTGQVHVYGQPAFQFTLPVSGASSSAPAQAIRFLVFHPGHNRLIAVDAGNTLHSYSLLHLTDHPNPLTHPPLPTKEGSYTLWGTITSVEQPLPSYTHLLVTLKDGTTLAWDLTRRILSDWKVGNMWTAHEERMVRSGIPGRHKTIGGAQATCIAMHPRDLNIVLLGYEGGVVAWNVQKGMVDKTFEMTLPPGAPGGGSYQDADGSLWTERTPAVSCITWRPDGLIFAVGHTDGCIAFWAYAESDKPLMVRTITHEDVNVSDAEELFSAGALDNQLRRKDGTSAISANREPIFKLSWAGFPDQPSLKALIAVQGTEAAGEPLSNATMDYAERGETLLLVLGGQSPGERPGVNILQFPAYLPPPVTAKKGPMSPSESMPLQERYAFRDSLAPTGSSFYPTRTPPEDFVLLPRSSPYFGMAHDPIAIIVSLTPDSSLSAINAPQAQRSVECWAFPPPRSTVVPPSPGRKNYVLPGEGEKIVAMTPAPVLARSETPRSASGGWKLPWTAATPSPTGLSPTGRLSTPDSMSSVGGGLRARTKARQRYRLPSSIWSGRLSVLTADIHSLPTSVFKRFISWSIENAGREDVPRIPIHGGLAVPDLQSHGAPDVKVAKMESYRILITSHPDATIRFWDISPHLLLLPTPLRFEYPGPLPHLTISLGTYLSLPDLSHLPLANLWEHDRSKVIIKSVNLAREALECTVTMVSGEIIVFKFAPAKGKKPSGDDVEELDEEDGSPRDGYFPPVMSVPPQESNPNEWVEEVLEIGHLARYKVDGFKPVAIFSPKRGEVIHCAVSDIGFLAVAFASKSLGIIDMRGPDVILREGFDADGGNVKKKKKKGNMQNVPAENSLVGAMRWVVAGMGTDSTPRPRLIVSYVKGTTKIYTLVNVLGEWVVEQKPLIFTNESLANPIASFVLDPMTGAELLPTSEALQAAMRASPDENKKETSPHCLWVAVSKKSIRMAINFNGDRVAKVELDEEELAEAFYITRHGQKVLVCITTKGTALFYSLPFLEFITRIELYYGHQPRQIGKISMDDRSGDFIEHGGPLDINLRTLFHFRKPFPPRLDPCSVKRAIAPQPLPLSYTTMSWIWGGAPITGAQFDTLIAGPNRPPLPKAPPAPRQPLITWGKPPDEPIKPPTAPADMLPKRTAVRKTNAPLRDAREREDAYTEMRQAAAERGNYLDNLGDSLNNVSVSATNYLNQARNAAVKEAAKGTARGIFGKLM